MARKGKLGQKKNKEDVKRPIRWRKYEYLFLIVCEDQKTEPAYFERLSVEMPEETMFIRAVGTGLDPFGVVEKALEEKKELENNSKKEVDYTWVVFDIDDADISEGRFQRFKDAFVTAEANGFNIAWSNEVFELWLLLHLIDISPTPGLTRNEIYQQLQIAIRSNPAYVEYSYNHPDNNVLQIIEAIGDESAAINRAKMLETAHQAKEPINANPCTRIHNLVESLRSWIAYYSL